MPSAPSRKGRTCFIVVFIFAGIQILVILLARDSFSSTSSSSSSHIITQPHHKLRRAYLCNSTTPPFNSINNNNTDRNSPNHTDTYFLHRPSWDFPSRHFEALRNLSLHNINIPPHCPLIIHNNRDLIGNPSSCTTRTTPGWIWEGHPEGKQAKKKDLCVIDDILPFLRSNHQEEGSISQTLKGYASRRLPHPLDFRGNPILAIEEEEAAPSLLVIERGRLLGTGLVVDDNYLYRLSYW